MICPTCGKDFKNLGVHKRFCGKEKLVVDDYAEKPLSAVISDIEGVLKKFSHKLNISLDKENGKPEMVVLTVRIPIRR